MSALNQAAYSSSFEQTENSDDDSKDLWAEDEGEDI
jgi:hypothetical protein